jgi:DNA-binding CsgD family transcriptional regulator
MDNVQLTEREKDVLILIAKGMRLSEVSAALGITSNTAAGYVKNIYRKLNISSRAEATLAATRLGLVHPH